MPLVTSPSGCDNCLHPTQKISELEGRIFILYQIKGKEWILDSLITTGPAWLNGPMSGCRHCTRATTTGPSWELRLGPGSLRSYPDGTLNCCRKDDGGKLLCHSHSLQCIHLTNKCSIQDEQDFPKLNATNSPAGSSSAGKDNASSLPSLHPLEE